MNGRGRERRYRFATSVIALYCVLVAVWPRGVISHVRAGSLAALAEVAGPLAIIALFVVMDLVRRFRQWRKHSVGDIMALRAGQAARWRPGPMLLGVGILCWVLSRCIATGYAASRIWFDLVSLSPYPFLLAGILLLLRTRSLSPVAWARVLTDALIVTTATATLGWYTLVGPVMPQRHELLMAALLPGAYPLCDLILTAAVLILSAASRGSATRPALPFLATATIALLVSDCLVFSHGLAAGKGLAAAGSTFGYMLYALAMFTASRHTIRYAIPDVTEPARRYAYMDLDAAANAWRSLLSYLCIPAVGLLVFAAWHSGANERLRLGVIVGCVILAGLALVRQVVALVENRQLFGYLRGAYDQIEARGRAMRAHAQDVEHLNRELRIMHDELERNNWALTAANRRLETMATTDPLTGLLNHGALVAALDRELERSQRYGRPCAVLFLDVDHFKALNDSYGHPAGDTALIEFSTAVRSTLRAADTLGRWGGEEFVAILPETGADDALLAAEKIRAAVVAYPFAAGGGTRLTCSVGVAACPTHAGDRSGLIKAADQAMYAAKRLGRDQARLADDPDVTTLMSEATAAESREEAALAGTVRALATLAALRNIEAVGHMQDIASLASRIAVMLGLDDAEARMIGLAGQLHDVGTAAIPDAVLGKPDRLTDEEWHVVRAHPAVGADVIGRVPGLGALAPLIRAHHERWDGHGYPDGLAGTETPLGARIVTVADAYSAMTTARPYREARTSELALHELWRCAGTQFDPAVVAALEQVLTKDAPRSTRDDIHLPANARSSD